MNRSLSVAVALCFAGLSACALNPFASDPVKSAREMTPSGTPFNQALYRAYLTRADEKIELGDRGDAKYFAARARAAGEGRPVLPEDVVLGRVGEAAYKDLESAHGTLVRHLVDGGRERAAEESAQAQSFFDCWVKETEEEDPGEIARCRAGYEGALAKLHEALAGAEPAPTTPVAEQPVEAPNGVRRDYLIYFGFDEWHLTAEALDVITEAVETARKEGQSQIIAAGHTDRAGPAPYNVKLSERRAVVVKEVMVEMGARPEAIAVEAHGEERPAVETADGVAETRNRRVEIGLVP